MLMSSVKSDGTHVEDFLSFCHYMQCSIYNFDHQYRFFKVGQSKVEDENLIFYILRTN